MPLPSCLQGKQIEIYVQIDSRIKTIPHSAVIMIFFNVPKTNQAGDMQRIHPTSRAACCELSIESCEKDDVPQSGE